MTYQIIDKANSDKVVKEFPSHRRAFNHSRKLEPEPSHGPKKKSFYGYSKEWRYQIRKKREFI